MEHAWVILNMWSISDMHVSSSSTSVKASFTPVLNLVTLKTLPRGVFIWGVYEARCRTHFRPCQGLVHETGISWSIAGFHFNKLAPNYPSIIVPGLTDVFEYQGWHCGGFDFTAHDIFSGKKTEQINIGAIIVFHPVIIYHTEWVSQDTALYL